MQIVDVWPRAAEFAGDVFNRHALAEEDGDFAFARAEEVPVGVGEV